MNTSVSVATQRVRRIFAKVPEITVYFWIVKLLTTAMGETTSDYLVYHINPFIAVALGGIGLVASLILQFVVRRYLAWIYWLVVATVSIFGTMVADASHIVLRIPYFITTLFFVIVLSVIFVVWYRIEKTLSIHSIYTRHREMFYWATVLATFALGTASGDMTAMTLHLGFFASGVLFTILFAIPALCYWLFGLNEIFAFWFAYIMTRPVGASFADWISVPHSLGGLGLGKGPVSIFLTVLIVIFVIYLTISHNEKQHRSLRTCIAGRETN